MLYLTRKIGESIMINSNIEVKIMEVKGGNVKLGFVFPKEASVLRKEVFDKVVHENIAAARGDGFDAINHDDFMNALDDLTRSMEQPAYTTTYSDKNSEKKPTVVVKRKIKKPVDSE